MGASIERSVLVVVYAQISNFVFNVKYIKKTNSRLDHTCRLK